MHFEAVLVGVRFIGDLHTGHLLRLPDAVRIDEHITERRRERIDRWYCHTLEIDAVGRAQKHDPAYQAASSFKLAVGMGGRETRIRVAGMRRNDHLYAISRTRRGRKQLRDRALERRWFCRVKQSRLLLLAEQSCLFIGDRMLYLKHAGNCRQDQVLAPRSGRAPAVRRLPAPLPPARGAARPVLCAPAAR